MEHAGNALVYGLKRFRIGNLPENELVAYVQHEALLWEYHKKAMELMDADMRGLLKTRLSEEGYKGKAREITDNENKQPDMEAGRYILDHLSRHLIQRSRSTLSYVFHPSSVVPSACAV